MGLFFHSRNPADGQAEAGGVAEILLREDGDGPMRLELVRIALAWGRVTRRHVQWLEEADALGEQAPDLMAAVERALGRGRD